MSCTTRCAANGRPPSQATQHRRPPAKPRPSGFRRYEPICGAAEPGRESLISTRNLQLAYRLISSETRLPEDLIRGSLVTFRGGIMKESFINVTPLRRRATRGASIALALLISLAAASSYA